ncbi:MAG: NAD(+)/NADH kinase [Actinomycetota bacterium]
MSRVGFVMHPRRTMAVDTAMWLERLLASEGVETLRLPDDDERPVVGAEDLDLVVSVGGDGTFLRAAFASSDAGCPVLGVKVGRLGFLTEVEPEGAPALIRSVLLGQATIEDRLALTVEPVEAGAPFEPQWGLNEIIVEKHARHRLVRLAVHVDGSYVTTFSADGVIVATPTGSTAYSFSARGPIVSPRVESLVLTPVAPHMVFDRSFVLHAGARVSLEVVGEESALLSADGRGSIELAVGSIVLIRASSRPARLVRRPGAPGFLELVREKFDLPGADPGAGPAADAGADPVPPGDVGERG